jgi:hypothetical protein
MSALMRKTETQKGLEAHAKQRLAALVLPVRPSHREAILLLPVLEPCCRGFEESWFDAAFQAVQGVLGLELLDFGPQEVPWEAANCFELPATADIGTVLLPVNGVARGDEVVKESLANERGLV